jgi:secreted PhoX family phosphatase
MTYMIQSTNVSNRLFRAKPDNVHAIGDTNGVLYFTEDGSKTPGLFVRDSFGTYLTFFHAYTRNYDGDEATGAAFSPDMKTLYCCLQEEGNCFAFTRKDGLTFEGGPTLKIRQEQSGPPEP